jgi:hypothetical protein
MWWFSCESLTGKVDRDVSAASKRAEAELLATLQMTVDSLETFFLASFIPFLYLSDHISCIELLLCIVFHLAFDYAVAIPFETSILTRLRISVSCLLPRLTRTSSVSLL